MSIAPVISVLMPTYNTPVYMLQEAVESILNQSFSNFEFIIIDDGTTNESKSYLDSISDERVSLIRNSENIGISKSLNIGLKEARGKYIARMDADDISLPDRFAKQLQFMEDNPDVFLCGSNYRDFGERNKVVHYGIKDMDTYRIRLLFINPGPPHSTFFIRRKMLLDFNFKYDESLNSSEDYYFLYEIAQVGSISVLGDVLLLHRVSKNQSMQKHNDYLHRCNRIIRKRLLLQLLDYVEEEELNIHCQCSDWNDEVCINNDILSFYKKLIIENRKKRVFNQKKFKKMIYWTIADVVDRSCRQETLKSHKIYLYFRYLPFASAVRYLLHRARKKI